ncbi:MAG TPA: hypothetical protein VEJ38_04785 [Candidatus Acidoferrales bacterium]|nr:hypothetical protein [Candidatus Acidoferrales bacterium]
MRTSAAAPEADSSRSGVALLGREDHPTDALEDYCKQLAHALQTKGYSLEISRVRWDEIGWPRALADVDRRFAGRRGSWVLLQFTALAWSRRAFPLGFLRVIRRLKRAGLRVLIVFHDSGPYRGRRLIDRVRGRIQLAVIRRAARLAEKIVSTTAPERVPWMQDPAILAKTLSIPIGSNLPVASRTAQGQGGHVPAIIVFGFSDLPTETALIASILRSAAREVGPVHLTVFGRGGNAAGTLLRPLLERSPVELEDHGILEPELAASLLANADVQLFIRSGLTSSRGSGIAGIVNGLPIVGFSDAETAFPITEAGVRLVPLGDQQALERELIVVLKDRALRESLRQRNLAAAERYFSWDHTADAYLSVLRTT